MSLMVVGNVGAHSVLRFGVAKVVMPGCRSILHVTGFPRGDLGVVDLCAVARPLRIHARPRLALLRQQQVGGRDCADCDVASHRLQHDRQVLCVLCGTGEASLKSQVCIEDGGV